MFKGLINRISTGVKNSILIAQEIREARQIEKRRLCKVVFVEQNGLVQDYIGKLSANMDYLVIENLNRLFIVDMIYNYKRKSRALVPLVFVSSMFHKTLKIEEIVTQLKDFDKTFKFKADDKGVIIAPTLSLNIYDNKKSYDFTSDAFTVLKSKVFEFLEETAKRTIYFVFLIGFLLGLFLGSILAITLM